MGWSIGYDTRWRRDIGYGVPALCDQPGCAERIDRGLGYVCGGEPYGGEHGCGLYFCDAHLYYGGTAGVQLCDRCFDEVCEDEPYRPPDDPPYEPTPDVPEWLAWKLTDGSWRAWREEHPDEVAAIERQLAEDRR